MRTCCAPAARPGCSTRCTRPRRCESCCASSPSGMPTSSPRWPASIWRRSRSAPRCCPASPSGRFWTSTRCCARSTDTTNKGLRSGTQRSPDGRCCARDCPRLITTLSVPQAAPVIAEAWLRSGKTGSGRGAARQVKQAVTTTRGCGVSGTIMLRGDSAFGTKKVIAACLDEQVEFSLALSRNRRVTTAIEAIDETEWTPVHYPGAVLDPDTGALISDAEVAETTHTLAIRGHGHVTARLVVRRVRDANSPDGLFPVWRYHPFFTNTTLPTADADLTHRKHAIVETTFAYLIDGPLAHIPSGLFAANCAWLACVVITHNLLRAAE